MRMIEKDNKVYVVSNGMNLLGSFNNTDEAMKFMSKYSDIRKYSKDVELQPGKAQEVYEKLRMYKD